MLYKYLKTSISKECLNMLGFYNWKPYTNYVYAIGPNSYFNIYKDDLTLVVNVQVVFRNKIEDLKDLISFINKDINYFINKYDLRTWMNLLQFQPIEDNEYRRYTNGYIYIFNNHEVLEKSPMDNVMQTEYIPIKGDWKKLLDEICLIRK